MTACKVLNPATEETLAEIGDSSASDLDQKIESARSAATQWQSMPIVERSAVLMRVADLLDTATERLAQMETDNTGKPIADSRDEVDIAANAFRYYAGAIDKTYGNTIPVDGGIDLTLREPHGVVAIIVPWNFPLLILCRNIAPALACGNAVIAKPSELTPMTALELPDILAGAGVPSGLFQLVTGPGETVGRAVVEHPAIAKVTFTGSTRAGIDVMRRASTTMKRLTLELGGKSANVIYADADLERAASEAPMAVFGNTGQDCCARSRILVERTVFEAFVKLFTAAASGLKVGRPYEPASVLGPLISARQRERVSDYVSPNANIAYQGDVPTGPGFWYPVTVMTPETRDMRCVQEEIFGPVATVLPFDTESEAIAIANETAYGLSGSIWTNDLKRAMRTAQGIKSGTLSINSNSSVRTSTPIGGTKLSGFGRQMGLWGMETYSELKNVYIRLS